jgi:hypothetical protein
MEENTKNTDRGTKKLSSLSVLTQIVSNFHCIYPNAFIRAHRDRFFNFDVVQLLQSFYSSHQWLCPLDAYGCGLSYSTNTHPAILSRGNGQEMSVPSAKLPHQGALSEEGL